MIKLFMANKKILLGLTYYLPNISGVTQYAVILAEELVKRNYLVSVVCSKSGEKYPDKSIDNGVTIYRIWGKSFGKGFLMPAYPWASLKLVKEHDVINCHLPSIESFWLALWGKIFRKKVIVTHHCEFNFTGTLSNKLISFLTFPTHWVVYMMADEIVSYTEDYAKTSVFMRYFERKIVYVLPPIRVVDTNEKMDFGKDKIVGFVGRISWEKGLPILLKAMKKVKAKLVIVGPYTDLAGGDKTVDKIKKLFDENVILQGPLSQSKLRTFYNSCDCLALPSTNNLETFGIVQAEAMVCGCPVVASNLPGVRVPVQMTGMGETCQIGDSDDLRQKIKSVLKNGREHYKKVAKNLDKFDYRATVDEYEQIFNAGV